MKNNMVATVLYTIAVGLIVVGVWAGNGFITQWSLLPAITGLFIIGLRPFDD